MQTFPRLTKLFGCTVDQLDEAAVRNAITSRVPESDELDFKREHHDDPDELAKDVAALANDIGGVLVLGVADDKAEASFANPVDISDDKQRHITTVINSRFGRSYPEFGSMPSPEPARLRISAYQRAAKLGGPACHHHLGDPALRYPGRYYHAMAR